METETPVVEPEVETEAPVVEPEVETPDPRERPLDDRLREVQTAFSAGDHHQAAALLATVDRAGLDELDTEHFLHPLERGVAFDPAPWVVFAVGFAGWAWLFAGSALH